MKHTQKSRRNLKKGVVVVTLSALVMAGIVLPVVMIYSAEMEETVRGFAEFQLTYRYYLKNEGPLNLTSVSIRLALLKDWAPIQTVSNLTIMTPPNQTITDEYENQFAWYEYQDFNVNQTIDLVFKANLTLNFIDYTSATLDIADYNESSDLYKLYMAFNPLEDSTDPNIRNVAQSLEVPDDLLGTAFNIYNFTSHYLKYKLYSTVRGASYAIRNANGDCDEYTTLFIALSRAVGIPAIGHTAWLADFAPGFVTSDDGAVAHAYPMFYVAGVGMLPADPTRGATSTFDNWLKTDAKRITLTRGPDKPYRLLRYRWIPVEGIEGPTIFSNYTVSVQDMRIEYTSNLRQVVILSLAGIPSLFMVYSGVKGYQARKQRKRKLESLLDPER